MSDTQKAIETIQTEKECVLRQQCDRDCGKCELVMQEEDILSAYDAAIVALQEKQHIDELRQRLHNIFGGDVTLDLVVDELQHQLEEPDKPHPLYAKILTYEDADKWKKWKRLEQQGHLVELPCAIGEYVYRIVETGASETYTIMHDGHEYSREVPFWGIWDCKFDLKLMDEFGKTVFLTLEAAQEALKKMEKAEGRR